MAALCLYCSTAYGQAPYDLRNIEQPLTIGYYIKKDMPLGRFINYSKDTASLADFKNKLVVLGFWFTRCGSCIAQFPKEELLQHRYQKDLQLILVTWEAEETVRAFIKKWEQKNSKRFTLPVIVSDTLLRKSIRQFANPHYAWVLGSGRLVAQTTEDFVSAPVIERLLDNKEK